MKMHQLLSLSLGLAMFVSCGKDPKKDTTSSVSGRIQEEIREGSFRAILRPFNNQLSGFLPSGIAEIRITGDAVRVKTLLDDDARVIHRQSIQRGRRCPSPTDDTNRDGIIDIKEGFSATGGVFLSLDDDLNSENEGKDRFPMGRGFTYQRSASLASIESDVRARTGEALDLVGRAVIIHGVSAGTSLPESVATIEGASPQASVPIACGILLREK